MELIESCQIVGIQRIHFAPGGAKRVEHHARELRTLAADVVLRLERAAPVVAIVAGASRSEPELAELLARLHAERLRNLRVLVDALAINAPLRLPEHEAVETVWALTSPELHQLLIRVRGWTRHRYRDWLADSLAQLLLQTNTPR